MQTSELMGRSAPDFSLTTLDGEAVSLTQKGDMPLLLVFFHSGCPWCRAEMPRLADVFRRHDNVDVRILGIVVGQDTPETAQSFVQERELNFPVAVDVERTVRANYPVGRVPAVIAVDRSGRIVRVYEGWAEQLPGIVDQTLMALARGDELPDYSLIGNGCAVG